MNDQESDSDGGGKKIKEEPSDPDTQKTKKTGPKSKTKVNNQDSESLMLTADKMMNKELNLLHAPIVLQHNIKTEVKDTSPKDEAKHSKVILYLKLLLVFITFHVIYHKILFIYFII